ncbi:MAG: ABC transporter permease subunit [Betaproteobacteria bacterium]|nr:ABC transporter permease subunit [Betaproteobacteria bacterium]
MSDSPRPKATAAKGSRVAVWGAQVAITVVFLLAWQYLPQIPVLKAMGHLFDPYFVSSPVRVSRELYNLATGRENSPLIWGYIWNTVYASLLGTLIGMVLGAAAGLVLSNFQFLSQVMRPFVIGFNAVPRIALVPIIVILSGPTLASCVIISVLVVFFVAFFNAYEGGTSVKQELIQNAKLLGASEWRVLRVIRMPFVLAWTLACLPLSVTFAVISVVTAEILTGVPGMGALLGTAAVTGNAALTFAVVIALAVVGIAITLAADAIRARVLHWWAQ